MVELLSKKPYHFADDTRTKISIAKEKAFRNQPT